MGLFLKNEKIDPSSLPKALRVRQNSDILSLSTDARRAHERCEENTHYEASMHESHYGRG